jgi:LysM repeat protein
MLRYCLLFLLLGGLLAPAARGQAAPSDEGKPAPAADVSAYDLILAMNTLRVSNGLPALPEDPILDAVAASTAATMAASRMSWHIGNVSGRVQAAGYGGGGKVMATENFAVAYGWTIDQIMQAWNDPAHLYPSVEPAYCNIGAGTAVAADGAVYYVLQAAYVLDKSCGTYKSPGVSTTPGAQTGGTTIPIVPQIIIPVKVATPDADGKIYHVVQDGQSFWAIAVAYKVTIKDIEQFNNLSSNTSLQVGQKLFIPSGSTAGYATPTPVGMIQLAAPDKDGKIVHEVQAYQALSSISSAYGTSVEAILALNGWQADWPLQIGQKLVIKAPNVTPTPTPLPLKPIQKLTPAADGKYYHEVKSGESLSYIAQLYEVSLQSLMNWNAMTGETILQPGRKILLLITPPATDTPTPAPATSTPTPTETLEPSLTPSQTVEAGPTATPLPVGGVPAGSPWMWGGIALGAVVVGYFVSRGYAKKRG